jgi:hypothetical protein
VGAKPKPRETYLVYIQNLPPPHPTCKHS